MIFCGPWLAGRLEAAEAANDVDCTPAEAGAVFESIAGGWAIFAGAGSPLTRAIGLGLDGPVSEAEIARLEDFFRSRSARVAIDFCPLASAQFLAALERRGYRPEEFNNAMVRPLAGMAPYPEEPLVRRAPDAESWAATVGCGFFEQPQLTRDELEIGLAIFRSGKAECWLATVGDGEPAAAGAVSMRGGTAVLFADSTVPAHRRQGLHAALIRQRLNAALAHGCDLAAATTAPASGSQRNYERLGFQVAYTKVLLVG